MRVWDVPLEILCKAHLLGEHREVHAIWSILVLRRVDSPYWHHPETQRWQNALLGLYLRHESQVVEMKRRGWKGHKSPLDQRLARGLEKPPLLIDSLEEQYRILRAKKCPCLRR